MLDRPNALARVRAAWRRNRAMTRRRFLLVAGLLLVASLSRLPFVWGVGAAAETLPARLSDEEFWKIVSDFSEPGGTFRSDNLLSNETWFPSVLPDLVRIAKPGGVYLGVGPEQNFTYIAALKPKMAFVVDIRRGNLDLHLMYKALFELSRDRAEFVSRLFSRKRPEGLGPTSTVQEVFAAYSNVETSEVLYAEGLKAIQSHLITKHGFALSGDDLQGIEHVYHAFYLYGPDLTYSSSSGGSGFWRNPPTYADLMTAADASGRTPSYLGSEEGFAFVQDLETKNLLVPVVGNFAGPKAIRAVATYLKENGATVSAFYLSNVEQYLSQDGVWHNFCGNAATLPIDEVSTFIRSVRGASFNSSFGLNSTLGPMTAELKNCVAAAR